MTAFRWRSLAAQCASSLASSFRRSGVVPCAMMRDTSAAPGAGSVRPRFVNSPAALAVEPHSSKSVETCLPLPTPPAHMHNGDKLPARSQRARAAAARLALNASGSDIE